MASTGVKVVPRSVSDERCERYIRTMEKYSGKAVRPYRADGFVNLVNRYGTSKDTSEHYTFQPEPMVPDDLLCSFYESNGLFSKIIDTPAEEAVKHSFTLDGITDQKTLDFMEQSLDELDWEETAMTAVKWARLFGGSIAVLLVNDGRALQDPLDWKNIKSIDDIRVYDRSVIQPDYSTIGSYDPADPFGTRGSRLGMPESYHVTSRYGSFKVHDSRCLVFQNGVLPENCTNSVYQLWGMPEYVRIHRAIRNAELAHESAPKMLDKTVQPVYKMKGLSSELSTEDGETAMLKRLQAIDLARGILNSIAIDSEGEDYDFKTFQFSGVAETIDATCNYLSALTSIPQTILFGRSPAGMNSTGESDMENYYNYVERIQKRMLKSNLRYLLSIIFQAGLYTGEINEMPPIKIKFNPLWSLTDKELAEVEQAQAAAQQTRAATVQMYVDMGVIDPSEVRQKLAENDIISAETMLDDYTEEELFANMPQQESEAPGMEQGGLPPMDDMGGNSPDAAPAATKLPEDMSGEEKEDIITNGRGDSAEIDGGSGSGNWGHEGRPGEVGGSAEGGGTHNRMTDVSGGYTSFSKEKKKFAAPHKVTDSELDKCPVGSKVAFEHDGEKVVYIKNENGFKISDTSSCGDCFPVYPSVESLKSILDSEQKDAAIYVPDSASPNYSIQNKEAYTSERKAAAPRTEEKSTVDAILRGNTEKVWKEADNATKDALCYYTYNGYSKINRALRNKTSEPSEEVKAEIDAITDAISKSKLDTDIWLVRAVDNDGAAASLGITYDEISSDDFDPSSLIGKVSSDDGFMSCGSTEKSGMTGDVRYSIYCPKGTEALYAEPFSRFGCGKGRGWDGKEGQEFFGGEFETILQRGTKCRVTNAYYDEYHILRIEMDVVAQKYK